MKDELLLRLESFEIDKPGVAFPFSARLAREKGWSRDYARRVIREYRRFLWLAMRAGHPVTPSGAVDEAWHLHLCYTRSYWDELCGRILGKPLHHGPTEGGGAEDAKFVDWYAKTLESYRCHFGEEAPAEIWPPVQKRFLPVTSRLVDPRTHWILPKRRSARAVMAAAGVALVPVLAGCTPLMGTIDLSSLLCLAFVAATLFVFVALAIRSQGKTAKKDDGSSCGTSGCGSTTSTSSCGSWRSSSDDGNSSHSHSDSGSDSGSSGCSSSSGCGSSGCGGGGCGGGS